MTEACGFPEPAEFHRRGGMRRKNSSHKRDSACHSHHGAVVVECMRVAPNKPGDRFFLICADFLFDRLRQSRGCSEPQGKYAPAT